MKTFAWISAAAIGVGAPFGCADVALASVGKVGIHPGGVGTPSYSGKLVPAGKNRLAMFALGCFWGSEYTFRHVNGVVATAVGFAGGKTNNPSYEQVCTHTTGHAEAVLIEYDSSKVSYAKLLDVFWASHDPTTLNRQGPDFGDQYRSSIFYFDEEQRKLALATRAAEQKTIKDPIVTEIVKAPTFWLAEEYHQQYSEKTGRHTCPPPRRPLKDGK